MTQKTCFIFNIYLHLIFYIFNILKDSLNFNYKILFEKFKIYLLQIYEDILTLILTFLC